MVVITLLHYFIKSEQIQTCLIIKGADLYPAGSAITYCLLDGNTEHVGHK